MGRSCAYKRNICKLCKKKTLKFGYLNLQAPNDNFMLASIVSESKKDPKFLKEFH